MVMVIVESYQCIHQPFGEPVSSVHAQRPSEAGNGDSKKPLKGTVLPSAASE